MGGRLTRASTRLPSIVGGLLAGAILVMDGVSIGALVFAGPLGVFLPQGITLGLVATFVLAVVVALKSSYSGTIATLQDATAILLGAIATGAATAVGLDDPRCLPTVLAAVSLATAVTGLFLYLLGRLKLGRLVRFIPYPVVGGFLAGTGWLIAEAALPVIYPGGEAWDALIRAPSEILPWLPGVGLGLLMLFATRRWEHVFLVPGLLGGSLVLFYLVLLLTGTSLEEARAADLLLGAVQGEGQRPWAALPLASIGQVAWGPVLAQGGTLGALLLIAAISVLLNATALELEARADFDMDRELRATGVGNLVAGIFGGIVGFHGISLSTLTHRMGARGRLPAIIAAGVVLLAIVAGAGLVALLPRAVVGGLLLYLGLAFVVEWIWDARSKLPRVEYALLLGIAGVVVFWDFLPGVAVGVVSSLFVFALRYSRIDFIKFSLSRAEHQSKVERAPRMDLLLTKKGEQVRILCLQGFLFFGTAAALYDRLRALLAGEGAPRFVILDFRLTSGLDASAAKSFAKIYQLAQDEGARLLFASLRDQEAGVLSAGGCPVEDGVTTRRFPDLDRGLAWCEDLIVAEAMGEAPETVLLRKGRQEFADFPKPSVMTRLHRWMVEVDVPRGATLGRNGDLSGALYFVGRGQVTVWRTGKDDVARRLHTVGPGNAVGGLEYMHETPAGVRAVADEATQILVLSREALEQAKAADPALVVAFQEMLLEVMADRLANAQRELATLLA